MTAISTVVGIGMMPLNAWTYSRSWVDHKTTVPIANIMIGLASMLIPVAIGMVIKIKLPKVAKVLPTVIYRGYQIYTMHNKFSNCFVWVSPSKSELKVYFVA